VELERDILKEYRVDGKTMGYFGIENQSTYDHNMFFDSLSMMLLVMTSRKL